MRGLSALRALIIGKAVLISKREDGKADVFIGRELDKQFVLSSLAGAVKHLML